MVTSTDSQGQFKKCSRKWCTRKAEARGLCLTCYKVLHREGKVHLFPRKNFKAEEYWKQYEEWKKAIPGISIRRAAELSGHPYERFRQGVRNHQIKLSLRSQGELPNA